MFITSIVFRNNLGLKSTFSGTSVFKNLLEKCILRRVTNFQAFNKNSRSLWTSSQRRISTTRFKKLSDTVKESFDETKVVLNNVLLFKFERTTAFNIVLTFAVVQLFGMLSMSVNMYKTFCPDLFKPTKSWKQKFQDNPFSILAIFVGCVFGPIIFFGAFFLTSRTIRRIILHKGGTKVTIVTYNVIPSKQVFTESLENISCKCSRTYRSTLPLKIKGSRFFYFIDTDGNILDENLFDFTVGVKREFTDN